MIPFKINLTAKQFFYALVVIGIFITGWMARGKFYPCPEPEIINDTTTVWIPQPIDSSGYEPQIIIFEKPVNEDSIYKAAQDYWYAIFEAQYREDTTDMYYQGKYRYRANLSIDKPNVKGNVSFNSRIALDPEGYFIPELTVEQKMITQTIREVETVTYNPDFFFEGAVRVDTSLSYILMAGVYPVSYKYLKSYIKAGIIYQNKPLGQAELGLRIEF